jgi:hypothetical protein
MQCCLFLEQHDQDVKFGLAQAGSSDLEAGSKPSARSVDRMAWRTHSLGLLPLLRAARSTIAVTSGWQRIVMLSEKRIGSFSLIAVASFQA